MSASKTADARKTERRRVFDIGLIRFGDASVDCVLRNLSDSGCALDVGPNSDVPDCFTLIELPNKGIYSCTVAWRRGRRIGVSFNKTGT